jgi:septal ring factor EnvC (AmiA/AmiB activator)
MAALLAVAALLAPLPLAAQEDPEEQVRDRIRESQERLEQIREERERLRREMSQLEQRVTSEREEIRNLEKQIASSASVVAELDIQVQARQEEVQLATRDMIRTRDELTLRKKELRRRLRTVYKRGPLETVKVLLSAESFSDLIHRYKYLHMITLYDRMLVRQVGRLEDQLEEERTRLSTELRRLRRLREEKREELDRLEELESRHQRRLQRYRAQESRHETRLARLARDEEKLRSLLEELERLRREAERRSGRATTSSLRTSDIGSLDWPVEGEVLYQFGPDRQGDQTLHRDGIGIAAEVGTPVQSVAAGRVAWAGARGLYGPSVIVSHGGGYYSVYLYLRNLRVQEGDRVAKGDVLGTVGGSDSREGPHIQFEIHEPTAEGAPQAVDPVRWLRSRQ